MNSSLTLGRSVPHLRMFITEINNIRLVEDTLAPIIKNCGNIRQLKKFHVLILKHSLSHSNFLVTKMVEVCSACEHTRYATLLFSQVEQPNVFLFNALIKSFTHNKLYKSTIKFYKQMMRSMDSRLFPDRFTFPFLLKSCAALQWNFLGKQIHAQICKSGLFPNMTTAESLLEMYSKMDNLNDARKVFDGMRERSTFSWNVIISGYARSGKMRKATVLFRSMPCKTVVSWTAIISGYTAVRSFSEALGFFRKMQESGVEPDDVSIVSILPACTNLGSLELGKWIHMYCKRKGLLQNINICNALIEMYSKCGDIDQAKQFFDDTINRDVITWSTIINALANHGRAREAISTFEKMKKANIEPNGVTFLSLLCACSHAGLFEEGIVYFKAMKEEHKIAPSGEHYGIVVDLLGRMGFFEEAMNVIGKMPMKPDAEVWGSLLSACKTHCNVEIGRKAVEELVKLEPDDVGNYVMLSNIYADVGKWDEVRRMRKMVHGKRGKRSPGCSFIEVHSVVEEFTSVDESKKCSKELFGLLKLFKVQSRMCNLANDEIWMGNL